MMPPPPELLITISLHRSRADVDCTSNRSTVSIAERQTKELIAAREVNTILSAGYDRGNAWLGPTCRRK